jgi:hypothetical protein
LIPNLTVGCFPLFALKQKVEQKIQGWAMRSAAQPAHAQLPVIKGYNLNCSTTK